MKHILFLFFFLFFIYPVAQSGTKSNTVKGRDSETIEISELVSFAKKLIGVPYKFGASNPRIGFDCSGFVYYVFKHFGVDVPRQSAAFKNKGETIRQDQAMPGDLILFTGTSPSSKSIGHIGIVTSREGQNINFVHSSSGNAMKVIETPLNKRYKNRFVKIIRLI